MDLQAVMARFRRVCWVYQYQFHSKLDALIGQQLPQLVEAPTVTSTSLYLSSRQFICAFADACKVFQGNYLVISFSLLYQLVANGVIGVALKASLLARQPFQQFSTTTTRTAVWLWLTQGVKPDHWDLLGVTISLMGTGVILFGSHRL
jgi:drug/metabolite transporter superfamily protein YnfA